MEKHSIIIPKNDSSERWIEALEEFISMTEPEWLQGMKGASAKTITAIKKCYDLNGDGKRLPVDYEIFLRRWGGNSYVSFPDKPISIAYYSADNMLHKDCLLCDSSNNLYLTIGSQDIDNSEQLSFSFLPSDDISLILIRPYHNDIKMADSFRQYLCCQAFLAFGWKQFPCQLAYELEFHMHKPPYNLSPEAKIWNDSNLSDKDLEELGFKIQVEKIQSILLKHGYQEAWFSTPLDQVWLGINSFCSISRDIDPNDMFDTVLGQICAYDLGSIQKVIEDFSLIGYKCIDYKKWRSY